ncbi:MAG TPA: CHASE3 domain-containing protein [Verrucomicrobiae bacterium]|jgi:signal transduction histidine kinase|nr:CHASE3 domain-containing protein [Verrucomicrobiae bacterium]
MTDFKQRPVNILLGVALGIVLLIFVSSYSTFRSYFRASDLREQSLLTLDVIQNLLLQLTDAETGQRGYLLTGKDSYLEPLQTSVSKIPSLLSRLRALRAVAHPDLKAMDRLQELIKLKADELEYTLAARRSQGEAAALIIVNTDKGKKTMDEVRRLCGEMTYQENTLLRAREASLVAGTRRSVAVLMAGTILTLILVAGSGWLTSQAMRKRMESEARLIDSVKLLNASNRELEQFAYVASHDLQEPLRMVSNYCQLLGRRYKGRLDSDANEFIEFAVSGAQRMQKLIDDLLAYSRVGSRAAKPVRTSVDVCFRDVLKNLEALITETGAVVTHDPLPEVDVDPNQLVQLLQNLIANGIKFSGKNTPPKIHVSVENKETEWLFGVRDQGIGIAPEYFDRIFVIFQRLHSKHEYPGTGIGLAICKKIVDAYGGTIRVESTPGQGSTFYFTLPRNPLYSDK